MPANKRIFLLVPVLLFFLAGFAGGGELEPLKPLPAPLFNPTTAEKVELGQQLFFDRRLSGDGTMSCATCHIPDLAFTDGQAISMSYPTTRNWRNAPTLMNLAYNRYLFHDGRAESIEDQVLFPILSAFEMNQNLDFLEEELRSVPEYSEAFRKSFGTPEVTRERIAMAIAAFERTLVSEDAPLDAYLKGDTAALSEEAAKGLAIFRGKGRCTECHYGMNLQDNKFHALNVPEHPDFQTDPRVAATRRFVAKFYHYEEFRILNEDPGRYLISKDDKDWRAFKTPTLREISKTGPYMHNGIFSSLDEVIIFYDQGGGAGNTALKPIGLSPQEKTELKTFLTEALSGRELSVRCPPLP